MIEDDCWGIYLDEDHRRLPFDLGICFSMAKRVWLHTFVEMCFVCVNYLAYLKSNIICPWLFWNLVCAQW